MDVKENEKVWEAVKKNLDRINDIPELRDNLGKALVELGYRVPETARLTGVLYPVESGDIQIETYACPTCGEYIGYVGDEDKVPAFCPYCGQAIAKETNEDEKRWQRRKIERRWAGGVNNG